MNIEIKECCGKLPTIFTGVSPSFLLSCECCDKSTDGFCSKTNLLELISKWNESLKQEEINDFYKHLFDRLPDEYKYVAMDKSGIWYGYMTEQTLSDKTWRCEDFPYAYFSLGRYPKKQHLFPNWKETLKYRGEIE